MKIEQYIKEVNTERKANKGHWVFWQNEVEGKTIQLKIFNTSIQIFRVNGIDYGSGWDLSVKDFKAKLLQAFN